MSTKVSVVTTSGRRHSVHMEPGRWIEVNGLRMGWVMANAVREFVRGETGYYRFEAPPLGAVR